MAKGASKISSGNAGGGSLYKGLYVEGSPGAYQAQADQVLKGVKDVLSDFGFDSELRAVHFSTKGSITRGEANASMNGVGDLSISTNFLQKGETNSNGHFVSDTFYGTGAHEAGHAVVNALLKNSVTITSPDYTGSSVNLMRATARSQGKLEKAVVKEASRRFGSNPKISGYGSKNVIEKVAEAVSDVYANKASANPYSKMIVNVLKDVKSGVFKPKISVTRRQMGI